MPHVLKRQLRLRPWSTEAGRFSGLLQLFGYLLTYSSPHPLHEVVYDHPDFVRRKERNLLGVVFGKVPAAALSVPELALGDPKRMLHLGQHCQVHYIPIY